MSKSVISRYDTARVENTFDQTGHGFSVLDAVYLSGTDWVGAKSDDVATFAQGFVVAVPDVNSVTVAFSGIYTITGHGLTLGQTQYLSDSVAGGLSSTKPNLVQAVITAINANQIILNLVSPYLIIRNDGNVRIESASEIGYQVGFIGDLNGNANITNPLWTLGRLVEGGVANKSVFRFVFASSDVAERSVFEVEDTGTCASVSDGTRRSHFEAFLNNGDTMPIFRLSSAVGAGDMGLQLGVGGTTAPDVQFYRNGTNSAKLSLGGTDKMIWHADSVTFQPGVNISMANSAGQNPIFRFYEEDGNGTSFVGLKAPASIGTTQTYELPSAAPSTDGEALVSTTAGVMSWSAVSGGGDLLQEHVNTGSQITTITFSSINKKSVDFECCMESLTSGSCTMSLRVNGISSAVYSFVMHRDVGSGLVRTFPTSQSSITLGDYSPGSGGQPIRARGTITLLNNYLSVEARFQCQGGSSYGTIDAMVFMSGQTQITSLQFFGSNIRFANASGQFARIFSKE